MKTSMWKKFFVLLIAGLLSSAAAPAQTMTNRKIAEDVIASLGKIYTLKYRIYKKERIKGVLKPGEMQVKYNKSPFKVYMYFYAPKPGIEILYVTGENNKKAYVNPNSFLLNALDPDLDPYGKTLRKDEHHTIFETGFDFTRTLLMNLKKRAEDEGKFDEFCTYQGEITWDGRTCYKLLLQYPDYKWENYTVKKGEDLMTIAKAKNINEYALLEKNNISWYNKVSEGQVIKIPNIYAKKVVLYVDKLHKLPLYQEVHDDAGLFAVYEYHGVIINPTIPAEEFTKGYKDYNF